MYENPREFPAERSLAQIMLKLCTNAMPVDCCSYNNITYTGPGSSTSSSSTEVTPGRVCAALRRQAMSVRPIAEGEEAAGAP